MVMNIIPVDSCLIYFYDDSKNGLTLIASKHPHSKLMGKITLKKDEGITGWVAEHRKSVVLSREAYKDKRFKFVAELPEDKYEAFFSLPIINKDGVVGVLNLQNREVYEFTKEQIRTIESVVKIVASAFQTTILEKKVDDLELKLEERKIIEKAKGLLMKEKSIAESEAYTVIRKEAMKKRKSMREIAEAVMIVYG
jgi:signal transduction protein with GAF and PtsI domain